MVDIYKKWLYRIVNFFLSILGLFIVIYMARDLIDISQMLFEPGDQRSLEDFSSFILAFFMLFEFIVMTIKYIEDTHNIPINYLVLISITAILRQLLVVHDNGLQTILLTLSILVLVFVLYILELIKTKEMMREKKE